MRFKKFFHVLRESIDLTAEEYGKQLKLAYKAIFNLDDDDFLSFKVINVSPLETTHHLFKIDIEFLYSERHYKVSNTLFHYKIPKEKYRMLSPQERDEFDQRMASLPIEPISIEMLKTTHPQIAQQYKIFEIKNTNDRFGINDMISLDAGIQYSSMSEYVNTVKTIIDKS